MFLLRLLIGLALLPTAAISLFTAAKTLGLLAAHSRPAAPFLAGILACALARIFLDFRRSCVGVLSRRLYVFGHELTHALAAWSHGGKVHGFKVGDQGGHVDLSHSNALIALAPYFVPLYTALVVFLYRLLLWWNPGLGWNAAYYFLMGLTLSFHLIFTFDCLFNHEQPDLAAAGGAVFSISLIGLANGLSVLFLLKILFPQSVALKGSLSQIATTSISFWKKLFLIFYSLESSR